MVNSLFNVLQRLFQVCLFINPLVNILTTNELKKPVPCRQSQLSSSPFASQTPWKEQNTLLKKTTFSENLGTVRVHNGKLQHTVLQGRFKDHIKFSRTTYQEYNNPQRVHKCTFPVYYNKPLRLELFAVCCSLVLNW